MLTFKIKEVHTIKQTILQCKASLILIPINQTLLNLDKQIFF